MDRAAFGLPFPKFFFKGRKNNMKRITIDKKEYIIEFSIEATLYNECTEKIMDMITTVGVTQATLESDDVSNDDKTDKAIKAVISNTADIPQRALTLFYAGLLEHHGADNGDGSVRSKNDAKRLLTTYLRENEGKSLYDVMNEMTEEIINDHFFEMIGVDKVMNKANQQFEEVTEIHE